MASKDQGDGLPSASHWRSDSPTRVIFHTSSSTLSAQPPPIPQISAPEPTWQALPPELKSIIYEYANTGIGGAHVLLWPSCKMLVPKLLRISTEIANEVKEVLPTPSALIVDGYNLTGRFRGSERHNFGQLRVLDQQQHISHLHVELALPKNCADIRLDKLASIALIQADSYALFDLDRTMQQAAWLKAQGTAVDKNDFEIPSAMPSFGFKLTTGPRPVQSYSGPENDILRQKLQELGKMLVDIGVTCAIKQLSDDEWMDKKLVYEAVYLRVVAMASSRGNSVFSEIVAGWKARTGGTMSFWEMRKYEWSA